MLVTPDPNVPKANISHRFECNATFFFPSPLIECFIFAMGKRTMIRINMHQMKPLSKAMKYDRMAGAKKKKKKHKKHAFIYVKSFPVVILSSYDENRKGK